MEVDLLGLDAYFVIYEYVIGSMLDLITYIPQKRVFIPHTFGKWTLRSKYPID